MARNPANSKNGQRERLSVDVGSGPLKKRKTKHAADIDANMKKKEAEFHTAMGLKGEPLGNAGVEAWNNYLSAKMSWMTKKSEERNTWTQLDDLNAEMDKMRRQPFRLVSENGEYEPIEDGYLAGHGHQKLRQRKAPETTSKIPAGMSQKKSREPNGHAAPQKTPKATTSGTNKHNKASAPSDSHASSSSSTMSQESDKEPSQGSAKKRRLVMELASSFVGGAWDASVDELGNRPRGSSSKMS